MAKWKVAEPAGPTPPPPQPTSPNLPRPPASRLPQTPPTSPNLPQPPPTSPASGLSAFSCNLCSKSRSCCQKPKFGRMKSSTLRRKRKKTRHHVSDAQARLCMFQRARNEWSHRPLLSCLYGVCPFLGIGPPELAQLEPASHSGGPQPWACSGFQ